MHFVKPTPRTPEQKLEERILTAFGQGTAAARQGKPRAFNHYQPVSQEEQWQAWNIGFDEEAKK